MHAHEDLVAQQLRNLYPFKVNLENCDEEPIRYIQSIQAHACLVAVELDTLTVRFASENTMQHMGKSWKSILDRPIQEVFSFEVTAQIPVGLNREDGFETLNPIQAFFTIGSERVLKNVIINRSDDYLLIEVEAASQFLHASRYQQLLSRAITKIQRLREYDNLFTETAAVLRQVTGYDRVMIYKFDEEYNGEVIAEARREGLEPFEGLRYPHTDIPKQARELYLKNRVRLISDTSTPSSPLRRSDNVGDHYLDLTAAGSRGVSPVHVEYLGYLNVNNSLSVAIVQEGKLWGLFAMHHYSPRFVDVSIRNMLLFVGQIFSGHLSLQMANRYRQESLNRNLARLAIGEMITKTRDIFEGLTAGTHNVLNMFQGTSGAAIQFDGRYQQFRSAPPQEKINDLIALVRENNGPENNLIFHHDRAGKTYPDLQQYSDSAAGIMIIFLNAEFTDWVAWFRPGISHTITWAGKPEKEMVDSGDGVRRLGPRKSFQRYVETVDGCSAPWTKEEIDLALSLRITIINSLMQRYSEVKQVNDQLRKALEDLETFSYTVSHDLRAPLRAINGYTEILAEDYGQHLDDDARLIIQKIHSGVEQMNNFITDILELSRVGSGGMQLDEVAPAPLAAEVISELQGVYPNAERVAVNIQRNLPVVRADKRLMRQLYLNLISNAFKYLEPDASGKLALSIGARPASEGEPTTYYVTNTGPAIPEEYTRTIFEMFSRLSSQTKAEGTGVGLAIVDRIVQRHNGKVWVTNDHLGVTFNFFLSPENTAR
ncbi:ATP-binding protein [Neolewinella litorea]|uniref:histidine kinase n=1 Tax=Neolewinella litorea TaxID=2562452 RepID=A0A4S4NE43_9BACT|nr:ATP-binding protein [Neolewinella litorea]THH36351.1 GAF domain-containing protein [Neolewinella litorea]